MRNIKEARKEKTTIKNTGLLQGKMLDKNNILENKQLNFGANSPLPDQQRLPTSKLRSENARKLKKVDIIVHVSTKLDQAPKKKMQCCLGNEIGGTKLNQSLKRLENTDLYSKNYCSDLPLKSFQQIENSSETQIQALQKSQAWVNAKLEECNQVDKRCANIARRLLENNQETVSDEKRREIEEFIQECEDRISSSFPLQVENRILESKSLEKNNPAQIHYCNSKEQMDTSSNQTQHDCSALYNSQIVEQLNIANINHCNSTQQSESSLNKLKPGSELHSNTSPTFNIARKDSMSSYNVTQDSCSNLVLRSQKTITTSSNISLQVPLFTSLHRNVVTNFATLTEIAKTAFQIIFILFVPLRFNKNPL